jgi:hypothetical protein
LPIPWNEYLPPSMLIGTSGPIIPLILNGEPGIPHKLSEVVIPEIKYDFPLGSHFPLVTIP